ncbi:MAG TPA: 4-hydroxy-3-methylbut-2-enyl diphosphate reductase [Candidatus Atribacteria bacterium]|jgi:4-hydroxy-3-methylbut-2-enyl diphosphate reductase|uniref:4-hydroxy-3-methylbut-2-enyl diphosphate reductase n=1 Tax=Candidatus Sordicultor fermentans TaxID=1953203 RepID=UPI00169B2E78|nr:4-hydroxy-3-methylbut-2-enyl diphosphate reductase [Atribacterota bacterium]NLY04739.1 4-hydroxy-3-methylbut-2-enyl diphosphate reductase [Candidatus Atribacteria bacterium]MDI9607935.1 4-hydroxy-3-methylbut-2-enyl diphosphate reductase [Atribacterota bacterium]MDY0134293.1 4-hydroxy-3-methylbut-2-enyl diphosphate reductase [Atribacterota bacterium]HOA98416.1 4-hydroxy-3-methylbut-2-enyl diphosphate reductase [Candidatus Atribacteria bacterium]
MEVWTANRVGFCPGVKRAFDLALRALSREKPVYFLGELVHNSQAVKMLEEEGGIIVTDPEDIPPFSLVVTRSHGLEKRIKEFLESRQVKIIDTTCPRVKKVQILAQELEKKGYNLVILGSSKHPEVRALLSFISQKALVLEKKEEWGKLRNFSPQEKLAVVEQTTFPREIKEEFTQEIKEEFTHLNLEVFDTLCAETEMRQRDLVESIKLHKVNKVVVVGGKNSSNTKALFLTARRLGIESIWVERVEELEEGYGDKEDRILVVSGTSTPHFSVEDVVKKLKAREASFYERKSADGSHHRENKCGEIHSI